MIRILLIGNYPADRQYSMQRYSRWLAESLVRHGWTVDFITPHVRFGHIAEPGTRLGRLLGYIDKYLLFPIFLLFRSGGYDLAHICDQSNAPYQLFLRARNVMITVHDLIAVKAALGTGEGPRTRRSGRILQNCILWSLKRIRFIVCVSGKTAGDVEEIVGEGDRRVVIVPNPTFGYSPLRTDESQRRIRSSGLPVPAPPYILHVGSDGSYKNRQGVLKIFLRLMQRPQFEKFSLVFVGPKLPESWLSGDEGASAKHRIFEILDPTSDVLNAIYSEAKALLFPSLEEGFGWPILDAQSSACPVITSNREPMKSIGGAAAFCIDPSAPEAAADLIDAKWPWIASQRVASLENSKRFQEQDILRQYLKAYEEACRPEVFVRPAGFHEGPRS